MTTINTDETATMDGHLGRCLKAVIRWGNGHCASKRPRQLTFLKFNNAGVAARNCPTSLHDIEPASAIRRGKKRNDLH